MTASQPYLSAIEAPTRADVDALTGLTVLDLSHNSCILNLVPLSGLTSLVSLNLSSNTYSNLYLYDLDFSPLSKLTNLVVLDLSDLQISNQNCDGNFFLLHFVFCFICLFLFCFVFEVCITTSFVNIFSIF